MNAVRLLTSLALLACYFPIAVIAGLGQTTNDPRSAAVYEYVPTCNITDDALLSGCKDLVNGLGNGTVLNYGRQCSYGGDQTVKQAFNPICIDNGECCIYTTRKDTPPEILKQFGEIILKGCADDVENNNNKINGAAKDEHSDHFCLSSGSGCSNCFHT